MNCNKLFTRFALFLAVTVVFGSAAAADLPEIRKAGVLRHLGIPYANFVTGDGDGMDVELIRGFAASLGLRYEYVKSDWGTVVEELVGRKVTVKGKGVELGESAPVRGDLIANGLTVLPWRKEAVDFSLPTFPSQIWVIARADSRVKPIRPTGDVDRDIEKVRGLLKGRRVLALKKTCLDPDLYDLPATGAEVVCFLGKLNELAPAVVNGEAEMTILDGPDALIALEKWSGRIKIIGPLTRRQEMAVGFPKDSPRLRAAFDDYLLRSRKDGSYLRLVKKYYPAAPAYFPDFFRGK
jgi:ABC-type amino acid transport substrate-binding protein